MAKKKKKPTPTHHVLFDDSISGVSQGWRCARIDKIGHKWLYFALFDGSDSIYKTKVSRWNELLKYEFIDGVRSTVEAPPILLKKEKKEVEKKPRKPRKKNAVRE